MIRCPGLGLCGNWSLQGNNRLQPRLQLLYTCRQHHHLLTQEGVFGFEQHILVFWRHAFMLLLQRNSG